MNLQPGKVVTIIYDPRSPEKGRWSFNCNWVFPLAIVLVSLLVGFAGLFPDLAMRPFGHGGEV